MKRKKDFYSKRAEKEGYPARSVYKLKEIQEKYGVIKRNYRVLDIGSSPGSWSLYLLRELGIKREVVGIDMKRIDESRINFSNFKFIHADIMREDVFEKLKPYAPFDVILSDVAPYTSGNRDVDAYRSAELVRRVVKIADTFLVNGGNIVVKIFQSNELQGILREIKCRFDFGKSFKPMASRSESYEIFIVGKGYKGCDRGDF